MNFVCLYRIIILASVMFGVRGVAGSTFLVEAESFNDTGGWVTDQQSMDTMGSPYLMAHGLGMPVRNAETVLTFSEGGVYRIWVRTRDWTAPWKTAETPPTMKAVGSPGKFQLLINGEPLAETFGTEGAEWHWQYGGTSRIERGTVRLALHDLTGFNGRCDAILFSRNMKLVPPDKEAEMGGFRAQLTGAAGMPQVAGEYDLVVVGGGVAGVCTAVSAARYGCKVALIQNRPVLGGNNSSEVRVGLSGLIHQQPYPMLGNLVDEIGPVGHWNLWEAKRDPDSPRSKCILEIIKAHPEKKKHNAGPASNYEDQKKLNAVLAEKNISLFLNTHVNKVEMDGGRIATVTGQSIQNKKRLKFKAALFADCTGDGNLGFLAGADYREGREAQQLTNEGLAPEKADKQVMGTSVQWYSVKEREASSFPECPWAVQFDANNCIKTTHGDWNWETGADRDQVKEIERIRDYGLRVIFGNWAVLKNDDKFKDEFANRRLEWAAYIGGKRESRRLMGDVILTQQNIVDQKKFPDGCVTTTWTIDLHYPKKPACACDAFQSEARHLKIKPYPIPFRCFYSRNIANLMMAGRNISVTHVALGTVRVMRTTGMMGEVLGMAAGLCRKHSCDPKGVYEKHLAEFTGLLKEGVPPAKKEVVAKDPRDASIRVAAYNVEFSKSTTPEKVGEMFKPFNLDLIGFNEVPDGDWTERVGKVLGMQYSYCGKISSAHHKDKYKSILSRTPLVNTQEFPLNTEQGWNPASVVRAETKINGIALTFYSLHICRSKAGNGHSRVLVKDVLAKEKSERVILAGDFNSRIGDPDCNTIMSAGMKPTWEDLEIDLGANFTWNALDTSKKNGVIDHIFYNTSSKGRAVYGGIIELGKPLSDHKPVWAEIEFFVD